MGKTADQQACIIGIGQTDFCRKPGSGLTQLGIQLKASSAALEDAGLRGKDIDGITYHNSGDWVESCTALAEDFDGNIKIIRWVELGHES